MQTKLCTKCKTEQPVSNFAKNKSTKTGLRSHCRQCCAIYCKIHYHKDPKLQIQKVNDWRIRNPGKAQQYLVNYRKRIRMQVLEHYGIKCACCGETEVVFLTLDHLQGGGGLHRKTTNGSLGVYREIIQQNFPPQYRILCMNCNWAMRLGHKCPHQAKAAIESTKPEQEAAK